LVQSAHVPPDFPHDVAAVPATQTPPVAAEQQPPLQSCVDEHAVVHACVVVSQAEPDGQSVVLEQPQAPPTHAVPIDFPAQSAHVAPEAPQAAGVLPALQVPAVAAEQHPPLQGWFVLQSRVQVAVMREHASPSGQLAVDTQGIPVSGWPASCPASCPAS
jgi:hypothetical protein